MYDTTTKTRNKTKRSILSKPTKKNDTNKEKTHNKMDELVRKQSTTQHNHIQQEIDTNMNRHFFKLNSKLFRKWIRNTN
jgi:hypothetical protein